MDFAKSIFHNLRPIDPGFSSMIHCQSHRILRDDNLRFCVGRRPSCNSYSPPETIQVPNPVLSLMSNLDMIMIAYIDTSSPLANIARPYTLNVRDVQMKVSGSMSSWSLKWLRVILNIEISSGGCTTRCCSLSSPMTTAASCCRSSLSFSLNSYRVGFGFHHSLKST